MPKIFSGLCADIPRLFTNQKKNKLFFLFKLSQLIHKNFCNLIYFNCVMKNKNMSPKLMIGEILNTSNFLIEINIEKKTNVIRKISFFFDLKKIIKFRKYYDFHYFSSSTDNFFLSREKKNFEKKKNQHCKIKKLFVPIDIIPVFFLKYSEFKNKKKKVISFFLKKKCSTSFFIKNHREKTRMPILGIDRRSFPKNQEKFDFLVDFKKGYIPWVSCKKLQKKLFSAPLFSVGLMIKFFKKRPIWTVEILDKFFPPSLKRYIKKILPTICYRFYKINPYQKAWIRNGYDPRGNRKSRIYQTLDLRKSKKKKKAEHKLKKYKKNNLVLDNFFVRKKTQKNTLFVQICDLFDGNIKRILLQNKKSYLSFFIHYHSGWFLSNIMQKIKFIS
ncbi:transcription factor subunit (nucleomorph) [Chroomonas mesostigmatica CCMP1168]|uniref:Transcription factor subunit n=1 Tax=Chroomonas mesostigmatica CCMP1168 TaxID=1195612 RepID=J7G3F3_9CRYP|nr:transcription factor subunit [Chroomonas mesostigmatica CCMP1168]